MNTLVPALAAVGALCFAGCSGAPPAPVRHAVTVTVTGAGEGTVAGAPGSIAGCTRSGGTCTTELDEGSTVTLTASPAQGHFFAGWSGACAGIGHCTLTVDGARTLRAAFVPVVFHGLQPVNGGTSNDVYNLFTARSDGTGVAPVTTRETAYSLAGDWSPDGERLLYFADADPVNPTTDAMGTRYNAWRIDSDGANPFPLTSFQIAFTWSPAWAPDGRIVYAATAGLDGSDAELTRNLWVVNADGTGRMPLTNLDIIGVQSTLAAVSASEVFYSSFRGLTEETKGHGHPAQNIFRVSLGGGLSTPITSFDVADAWGPQVSPDGNQVVFASDHVADPATDAAEGAENFWVVNRDGSGLRRLTDFGGDVEVSIGRWSPDGLWYVFDSDADPTDFSDSVSFSNVYRVNVATGQVTALTTFTQTQSRFPKYAPDGTKIIFDSYRVAADNDTNGAASNVYTMNPDGSGVQAITTATDNAASSYSPANID